MKTAITAGILAVAIAACAIFKPTDSENQLHQARVVGTQLGGGACFAVWTHMAGDRVALQHTVTELRSILASDNPSAEAVNRLPLYFHDPEAQLYIRAALSAVLVTFAPDQLVLDKGSPAFVGLEAMAEECGRVIATNPSHQGIR